MTTLDLTKPVQTRSGHPARILCTDLVSYIGRYPIVAAVRYDGDSHESLHVYTRDGKYIEIDKDEDPRDLVNVPAVRHEFVNVIESSWSESGHINRMYVDEAEARADTVRYSGYVGTIIKRYENEKLVSTTFVKWEAKD